jgi:predicted membrane protein
MEAIKSGLIALFGVVLSITVSILVMIHGWGLEPKSWWWIIPISFFGQISAQIIVQIGLHRE